MNTITILGLRLALLFVTAAVMLSMGPAQAQNKRLVEVPISDAPSYAKRALVVGVTDYDVCPKLNVCGNDAKEFAELLKTKFGFSDVILMTDAPGTAGAMRPTQRNLKRALETLYTGLLPEKSEVVLFFSGHGVRARDLGGNDADWLVPEDGDPHDVPGTCVNYDAIKQRLDTLRPARVLLVSDACRSLLSGKAAGEGSGFGKGLKAGPLGPEVAELQSCQPTEVSQEGLPGDFPESVFTHFLVKGMNGDSEALADGSRNVTFDSLKVYVQGSVSGYVASHFGNASQVPDGRATLGGMVLARVTAPVIKPSLTPEQQQQANARLVLLWTDADGGDDKAKADAMTLSAVQQALDAGADVNAKDRTGETALPKAAFHRHADIVRLLLDKGADTNARDKDGDTALTSAAGIGADDIVRLLLDKGADINVTDNIDFTALMAAASNGHADAVRLLLDKGANINAKNSHGQTALSIAIRWNHSDVAAILRAAGAKE